VSGATANEHAAGDGEGGGVGGAGLWLAARCETDTLADPILTVPIRSAPVFSRTAIVTTPLPVPLPPAVMVRKGSDDVASQLQDGWVDTVTESVPAAAPTVCVNCSSGIATTHAAGADAWGGDEVPEGETGEGPPQPKDRLANKMAARTRGVIASKVIFRSARQYYVTSVASVVTTSANSEFPYNSA
jgi:hypothetical protein